MCRKRDRHPQARRVLLQRQFPSMTRSAFEGIPVPWSRHLYFADNWLARNSWVFRVAVSAYVLIAHPPVSVPDPTERLIGM